MEDIKVLFVEDSPTMRRIILNSLKGIGFRQIIEAEKQLAAARSAITRRKISARISNLKMKRTKFQKGGIHSAEVKKTVAALDKVIKGTRQGKKAVKKLKSKLNKDLRKAIRKIPDNMDVNQQYEDYMRLKNTEIPADAYDMVARTYKMIEEPNKFAKELNRYLARIE